MTLARSAPADAPRTLVIACGALGRELAGLLKASRFRGMDLTCLPAILHNRPEKIAPAVQAKIRAARDRYTRILCLYGDCGTGGDLDRVLAAESVERIPGAHCYAFLAGEAVFETLADEEPGTFYLTDYLARHFDDLVIRGLGIDRHPELQDLYFGHYKRLVYLAQSGDAGLDAMAQLAAERLGLSFERRWTGLDTLAAFMASRPGPMQAMP